MIPLFVSFSRLWLEHLEHGVAGPPSGLKVGNAATRATNTRVDQVPSHTKRAPVPVRSFRFGECLFVALVLTHLVPLS